ncbi:hypothetical protein D3C85_1380450 [compost metagenome]
MVHLLSQVEFLSCCSGIATADYCVTISCCTRLCYCTCTVGERLDFEYAHRSVPNNQLGFRDNVCIKLTCFRSDVNAFPISRNAVDVNDLRVCICAEFISNNDIYWK